MKKNFGYLATCICLLALNPIGYAKDSPSLASLEQRIQALEEQNAVLRHRLDQATSEIRKLWVQRNIQKKNSSELSEANRGMSALIQSQGNSIEQAKQDISKASATAQASAAEVKSTLSQVKDLDKRSNEMDKALSKQSYWGLALVLLIAACSGLLYFLFRRKLFSTDERIANLKEKTEKLNEEIIEKLSTDLQKLTQQTTVLNSATSATNENHDLIKTLADRITFMEMTLFKMDKSVKGYRQLAKSINQMKDNLLANGYEVVNMLGLPYQEGMKAVTSFIDDDTLPSGQRIITAIIKPQINFKGEMIQSAQISVSQNV